MRTLKRLVLIVIVVIGCVGCDQITKFAAESYLPNYGAVSFLGGTVRLQLAHNQGAFLGFGAALPEVWRNGLFLFGPGIMLLALLGYSLFSASTVRLELLAFALLLAGGAGNLLDRLMYDGYVIDFINIGIGTLRTGIFNVADIAVTTGVLMLISGFLWQPNKGL